MLKPSGTTSNVCAIRPIGMMRVSSRMVTIRKAAKPTMHAPVGTASPGDRRHFDILRRMKFLAPVIAATLLGCTPPQAEPGTELSAAYAPGPFAVGVKSNFVKDFSRPFDAWGAQYKSDAYRALLARIDASGEPSTTVTNIYYPSPSSGVRVVRRADIHPSALWAAKSGRRQTTLDMFMGDEALASQALFFFQGRHTYQSFIDAPLASGKFPLVVMLHGLGGGLMNWNRAAEYLASHGYIVVTLAYSSDSADTPVFHDPNSLFAKTMNDDERLDAYRRRSQESPVFRNFMKFLYGFDGDIERPSDFPDPDTLSARRGGGLEAAQMMAKLFEQRTEDLGAVIREMKALGGSAANCRATLEANGIKKELCGFFTGAVDAEQVGVMGHSLGAITAQSALVFLPEVDTAIAFNNGLPKRWEPYGGFPNPSGSELPDGVPKDFMIVIGSDDAFVHMVFRDIHMQWFTNAGGDISETYPLAIEQEWPTSDNPQPIARAAYERAQGAKVLIMFRDQGHGTATDDEINPENPGATTRGRRVPLQRNAAQTEEYDIAAWMKDEGGYVFLPHQMRNYFITAWFDWQLKGDDAKRAAVVRHPFADNVKLLRSEGVFP